MAYLFKKITALALILGTTGALVGSCGNDNSDYDAVHFGPDPGGDVDTEG